MHLWDQIFQISAIHPGVKASWWMCSHHWEGICLWGGSTITSASALYRLIRILYPGDNEKLDFFLRQCGGSQQLPKRLRQNQLIILSFRSFQRATEDKSLHDKEKATLVTSLLVSLHLQYHVWFAATKGTCHPPTFCLLCIVYAKNMRSHHKAYRMDTMRHHVYMQQQSSGSLPSTRQMWFEQI